jgi:hypothetical protein
MELDSAEKWVVALCFGVFVVGMYSWSRFDEPSYDSQTEYFARYKPRFATSYARYARAKCGYVAALVLIYVVFSLVPELFYAIAGAEPNGDRQRALEASVPLAVALGLYTLRGVPGLKDLERQIRGFLHSFARIPDCVRRTVAQMRGSPFNLNANAIGPLTRKLGLQNGNGIQAPVGMAALIEKDDLLKTWYVIGCLLCALSESNRDKVGIDARFFDNHEDELDSIRAKHAALAELVRLHVDELLANQSAGIVSSSDLDGSATFREIRELRNRLYTFVACGVHSSVKSDAESLQIVTKMGFAITSTPGSVPIGKLLALAGLSFIALTVLSIITANSTQVFIDHVLSRVGRVWVDAFPVPKGTLGLFAWSWTTAIFYFMAILGALAIRHARVAKREWFDLTNLNRERPVLRYITPTLVGTAFGCFTLTAIALNGGPAFKASFSEVSRALGEALRQTLPWLPLATAMSFIAVLLSDSRLEQNRFWRGALGRAGAAAAAMALVGLLTSQLSISAGVTAFAERHGLDITAEVSRTGLYLSLFISAQIGLLVFALCLMAQVVERQAAGERSLAGKSINAVTRQGLIFCATFDRDGTASLFPPNQNNLTPAPMVCRGRWESFPEGTVVKWDHEPELGECKVGSSGLISSHGNSLIYEGFVEQISMTADFVAQVHDRTSRGRIVSVRTDARAGLQGGGLGVEAGLAVLKSAAAQNAVREDATA